VDAAQRAPPDTIDTALSRQLPEFVRRFNQLNGGIGAGLDVDSSLISSTSGGDRAALHHDPVTADGAQTDHAAALAWRRRRRRTQFVS
jgi:hypothetical protein